MHATLTIELADGADTEAAMSLLEARLAAAPEVQKSLVTEDTDRFGVAETVALLAASVVLIKQGTEVAETLTKFVKTLRTLVGESRGLASAIIEIKGEKIDAATAKEEQIAALIARIEADG